MIVVSVPFGTNRTGMNFTVTHTGASISPAPGTPLDFTSPQTFMVTAANGQQKTYTVTVNLSESSIPDGGTAVWPSTAIWQNYGLTSGLTQPSGTTVSAAMISSGTLAVSLENADTTALNNLENQLTTVLGVTPTTTSVSGLSIYEYAYTVSGTGFTLTLFYMSSEGILMLSIEPGNPSNFIVWPNNSRWTAFNLSNLTQPSGTTVDDVTESVSASPDMLSITLSNTNNTAYEDLLTQITTLLGNPYESTGSSSTSTREAIFISTMGADTLVVTLEMDTLNIFIAAFKY
jgi:hypothetical protein